MCWTSISCPSELSSLWLFLPHLALLLVGEAGSLFVLRLPSSQVPRRVFQMYWEHGPSSWWQRSALQEGLSLCFQDSWGASHPGAGMRRCSGSTAVQDRLVPPEIARLACHRSGATRLHCKPILVNSAFQTPRCFSMCTCWVSTLFPTTASPGLGSPWHCGRPTWGSLKGWRSLF